MQGGNEIISSENRHCWCFLKNFEGAGQFLHGNPELELKWVFDLIW